MHTPREWNHDGSYGSVNFELHILESCFEEKTHTDRQADCLEPSPGSTGSELRKRDKRVSQ